VNKGRGVLESFAGKGWVTLATQAKQRLPVPEPRECPVNADGNYHRQNSPKQEVGDQEHRAGHRQGEEGQSCYVRRLDVRSVSSLVCWRHRRRWWEEGAMSRIADTAVHNSVAK
jgi:hypothetical protein